MTEASASAPGARPRPLNDAFGDLRPSGIRRFSQLASQTPGCISLTLGEPGEDTPAELSARVLPELEAGMTHYPPNNGHAFLREGIAFDMVQRGMDYAAGQIIVTSGATEALFVALSTLLNPGDEVVIPEPSFILYESITKLCRAVPVGIDTAPDGFQLRDPSFSNSLSAQTKAIVISSPNNPTGCLFDDQSLDLLAREAAARGLYVICDEVYGKLVYEDSLQPFAARYPELKDRTIVVDSFSKPYAMTGWRLGWLAASDEFVSKASLVHQYAVSSVPSFTQRAALSALSLDLSEICAAYKERRDFVVSSLREMGLSLVEPRGAFYAFPSIQSLGLKSEEFCLRAIKEAGVALVPGSLFGGEGHVRISYACSMDELKEGMRRLAAFVQTLHEGRHS